MLIQDVSAKDCQVRLLPICHWETQSTSGNPAKQKALWQSQISPYCEPALSKGEGCQPLASNPSLDPTLPTLLLPRLTHSQHCRCNLMCTLTRFGCRPGFACLDDARASEASRVVAHGTKELKPLTAMCMSLVVVHKSQQPSVVSRLPKLANWNSPQSGSGGGERDWQTELVLLPSLLSRSLLCLCVGCLRVSFCPLVLSLRVRRRCLPCLPSQPSSCKAAPKEALNLDKSPCDRSGEKRFQAA